MSTALRSHVLIVDDDFGVRASMRKLLEGNSDNQIAVFQASNIEEAFKCLADNSVDAIILDKDLKGEVYSNGIDHIPELKRLCPNTQILVFSGSNDVEDIVKAMKLGAMTYLPKASDPSYVHELVEKAIHFKKVQKGHSQKTIELMDDQLSVPGSSLATAKVNIQLKSLFSSSSHVLLLGPTGAGKTTAARILHNGRSQHFEHKDAPFMSVNMAAIPEEIQENILFGHEAGAFTGASKLKQGYLELADNGTLFLDEIAEAPLALQAKLLKALDEKKFFRVGGKREIHSDFRLICATNKNLEHEVAQGRFREDLYMRICAFPIQMPSLEERVEDIPEIIKSVLKKVCLRTSVQVCFEELPSALIRWICQNPPRGNIRGIEQILERILTLCPKDGSGKPVLQTWRNTLDVFSQGKRRYRKSNSDTLNFESLRSTEFGFLKESDNFPGLLEAMSFFEHKLVNEAFNRSGSVKGSAEILKISMAAASKKIKKYCERNSISHERSQN